ncbi:hypothetical protein MY11210_006773 [Beauveria gryllotalpidicola]
MNSCNTPDYATWPDDKQRRWCQNQVHLINATLDAEDYVTALHFCEVGLKRVTFWPEYSFVNKLLWIKKSHALTGLGLTKEAAVWREKAAAEVGMA